MRIRILIVAAVCLCIPRIANAGGFEFPSIGTHALARGGAFHARADDPLALYFNPAQLAELEGIQLTLQSHVVFYEACFDRAQGWSDPSLLPPISPANPEVSRFGALNDNPPEGYQGLEFPTVCNSGPIGVVPELALSWRISDKFGIGIGFIAPSGVGSTTYGNPETGTIADDRVNAGELPAPSRYHNVDADLLIMHPSIGFGYAPHPRFRFGATFGWGIAIIDHLNYSRETGGETISGDIRTRARAKDLFVPGLILSAHAEPIDGLDVMLGFRWNQAVQASGDVELTSGDFRDVPIERRVRECRGEDADTASRLAAVGTNEDPQTGCIGPIENVEIEANLPWQLQFGIRYASRIADEGDPDEDAAEAPAHDPLSTERWDIELNVVYERNSIVDNFTSHLPAGSNLVTARGGTPPLPLPEVINSPLQWKDQISLRLGSDYNWLPGRFATSAGFSFETNGVDDPFVNLDFMPHRRFGLHVGATLRVGPVDLHIAYAHLFVQSRDVSVEEAAAPQIVATSAIPPTNINAGAYSSHFNILSLGATARF